MPNKLARIKMLIMDVDGTLTNGKIYIGNNGEEIKAFNVKDGYGIKCLLNKGIIPAIITGRNSKIVEFRARELGVTEVHQGILNKLQVYIHLKEKYGLTDEQVAYVGDDLNDWCVMEKVGLRFCVGDAANQLREKCDFVCKLNGGEGAVREVIDMLLESDLAKGENYGH